MEHNGTALLETMAAALKGMEGMEDRVSPVIDILKSSGPLVVYDQTEETELGTLTKPTGLMTAQYQIYVLHNTYLEMRQLAEKTKITLEALQGHYCSPLLIETVSVELGSPDILETKVRLFRRTYNITFEYQFKEE